MKGRGKLRLDDLLAERGLVENSRTAQAMIMAGKVMVGTVVVTKAGTPVDPDAVVTVKEASPFVGRGGLKLAGALDEFGVDALGVTAIDVGASTGGFTDCLLKRGAAHVYAIDVGKGILDASLRNDARVTVLEGRNFRYLDPAEVPVKAGLAVIDVSFISLEKGLPKVKEFLKEGGRVLALVKPQFEVARDEVGKGGIVRDPALHKRAVERILEFSASIGFTPRSTAESPITGAKGNREFWVYLVL